MHPIKQLKHSLALVLFELPKTMVGRLTLCIIFAALIAILSFLFWQECRNADMREQKYQKYMKECDREIEELRNLQEYPDYEHWI